MREGDFIYIQEEPCRVKLIVKMFARHLGNKVGFQGQHVFTQEIITKSFPRKSYILTFKPLKKDYILL